RPLAHCHHFEQFRMRQTDAGRIARRGITVEREQVSVRNQRLPFGERPHPQLRPLQVAEDGNRTAKFLFERPHRPDGPGMSRMLSVAEVHTEGGGTRAEQAAENVGVAARRAERSEELDLAAARSELCHASRPMAEPG